jgi:hypothetical protein
MIISADFNLILYCLFEQREKSYKGNRNNYCQEISPHYTRRNDNLIFNF